MTKNEQKLMIAIHIVGKLLFISLFRYLKIDNYLLFVFLIFGIFMRSHFYFKDI